MTLSRQNKPDRAARRMAIEAIISRYPDIREDELHFVFAWFRKESSAFDRRAVAGNRRIREQYRLLCRDHSIERLPWVDTIVAVAGVFLLVLGILFLAVRPA